MKFSNFAWFIVLSLFAAIFASPLEAQELDRTIKNPNYPGRGGEGELMLNIDSTSSEANLKLYYAGRVRSSAQDCQQTDDTWVEFPNEGFAVREFGEPYAISAEEAAQNILGNRLLNYNASTARFGMSFGDSRMVCNF